MSEETKPAVLVVDDTEANVDILVETLDDDYEVLVALDGETALEIAAEEPLDLVLLDVMMPDMDGYEVISRLKSDPKTKDVPVIFVTAKTEIDDETKGFSLGAMDYITKPISPSVVKARVESAVSLKQKTEELAGLSEKLSRYLDPQVYASIFSGAFDSKVASHRKKLTVFYSDIVSFTETTEQMQPEDMTELLNSYLNAMSEIAIRHGGTIDKFIGDAILIFFGDPESRGFKEDALACVNMALEMREKMTVLQAQWADKGLERPFKVRTGISTGYCTVGNFGSKSRVDYTIIGGTVNLAARLEQNAPHDQILISRETWALVKDEINCISRPPIAAKGFGKPIPAYQVIGSGEDASETKQLRVGDLVEGCVSLTGEKTVQDAREVTSGTGEVVVVDSEGVPLGLVTRLAMECAGLKGGADAALAEIMDGNALVADGNQPLEIVARQAEDRPGDKVYDPIIIVTDGRYEGIVSMRALLSRFMELCAACAMD